MKNPWNMKPLDEWSIVGMNHYHVAGSRRLFVAMTNDGDAIYVLLEEAGYEIERLRRALRDIDAVYVDPQKPFDCYERIMRITKDALLYPQGKEKNDTKTNSN